MIYFTKSLWVDMDVYTEIVAEADTDREVLLAVDSGECFVRLGVGQVGDNGGLNPVGFERFVLPAGVPLLARRQNAQSTAHVRLMVTSIGR